MSVVINSEILYICLRHIYKYNEKTPDFTTDSNDLGYDYDDCILL